MSNSTNDLLKNTLLNDNQWNIIDGEPCLVTDFSPLVGNTVENEVVISNDSTKPYASITIECKKLPEKVTGLITHKIDFLNLWKAFKEKTISSNEEVIIFWSKKHYKLKLMKFLPGFWPKLWIMVCHKGTFEAIKTDFVKKHTEWEVIDYMLEPIAEWRHEIMEEWK